MASPTSFCFTISTEATDSSSKLCPSWIRSCEDYLPPVHPSVRILSVFLLSNWIKSKTVCCISKMLTLWTVPHCLTSSPTYRSLTAPRKFGPDGLGKPGKPSQAVNRMIDSNRTSNKVKNFLVSYDITSCPFW